VTFVELGKVVEVQSCAAGVEVWGGKWMGEVVELVLLVVVTKQTIKEVNGNRDEKVDDEIDDEVDDDKVNDLEVKYMS